MENFKLYIKLLDDEIDSLIKDTIYNDELTYETECELYYLFENRKHVLEMISEREEKSKITK